MMALVEPMAEFFLNPPIDYSLQNIFYAMPCLMVLQALYLKFWKFSEESTMWWALVYAFIVGSLCFGTRVLAWWLYSKGMAVPAWEEYLAGDTLTIAQLSEIQPEGHVLPASTLEYYSKLMFNLEMFAFMVSTLLMFCMDIIDMVVFYPALFLSKRRKITDQDYLTIGHHIFGTSAMVMVCYNFYELAQLGNPAAPLSVSFDWASLKKMETAWNATGLVFCLCTAKFANQFVYMAEVSSVPLSIRGVFKDRAVSKKQQTNPTVRLFVDVWFMISFFACRTIPTYHAIKKLLVFSPHFSKVTQVMFGAFTLINMFWASQICTVANKILIKPLFKGKSDGKDKKAK